jgi:hypothetical protein
MLTMTNINTNNALVQELEDLNKEWALAVEAWDSLKGRQRLMFEYNELNPLRVKIYNLEQRIKAGEVITIESKKQKELEKLDKELDEAIAIYFTLKGRKKMRWEETELNPLRVQIYNLKKELGK